MNSFKEWILYNLIKGEIKRGRFDDEKIKELYKFIIERTREEFIEDDVLTLKNYLTDMNREAIDEYFGLNEG
jgi:hypothetical protein